MDGPARRRRGIGLRLFAGLRFAVYAAVVALGAAHFMGQGGASAERPKPAPRVSWLSGRTWQGRGVSLWLSPRRVHAISLGWSADCPGAEHRGPFSFEFEDLRVVGGRFSTSAVYHGHYRDGTRTRVQVELVGWTGRRGPVTGYMAIRDQVRHPGAPAMACDPGVVTWRAPAS